MEHRLDDADMARFLRDGMLCLRPPELDAAFHARCFTAAAGLYDEAKRQGGTTAHMQLLGDNLLAQVPPLHQLLAAPSVHGALASVLGDGYVLHPHQFVHAAGRMDQGFHQDGNLPWNTRGHFRSPRPIAAILFYYPQAVTDEMGPTEVLPGTQYWRGSFEEGEQWHGDDHLDRAFDQDAGRDADLARRDMRLDASLDVLAGQQVVRQRLCVPAGTVALLHYDLVHRGTRQAPGFDGRRYMYKFYFLRTREPVRAAWNNVAPRPPGTPRGAPNEAIVERSWRWLRGEDGRESSGNVDPQLPSLMQQLHNADERTRRDAGYLLGDAGAHAAAALCTAAADPEVMVRRMAAFALGETRHADASVVTALVTALADADSFVRSNAAFSLGSLARVQPLPPSAIDALLTRLDAQVEPDNTRSAGMSRSTVRECVVQALLMAASNAGLDDTQRMALAERGLADGSRYVRGLAVQALLRSAEDGMPRWLALLLCHLDGVQYQSLPPQDDALSTDAIANDANSNDTNSIERVRRRAASPATLLGLRV